MLGFIKGRPHTLLYQPFQLSHLLQVNFAISCYFFRTVRKESMVVYQKGAMGGIR